MGGEQETGEDGEQEVVTVAGQGVARAAAPAGAEDDLPAETRVLIKMQFGNKVLIDIKCVHVDAVVLFIVWPRWRQSNPTNDSCVAQTK